MVNKGAMALFRDLYLGPLVYFIVNLATDETGAASSSFRKLAHMNFNSILYCYKKKVLNYQVI